MFRSLSTICIVTLWAAVAYAVPFHYHEDFETKDPTTQWATNGKCKINFKGLTTEAAHDGTHSLKLDITLESGSYHYWSVPVSVPVAGKLTFTGWIKVVKPSTATVGLGPNFVFPPTPESGCGAIQTQRGPTDGWKKISGDLVERGAASADGVVRLYAAGATGANVVVNLDRWGIFVLGAPGTRLVCYVDDVTIDGDVPSMTQQTATAQQRFAPVKERQQADIADWTKAVDTATTEINGLTKLPPNAEKLRRLALDTAHQANELIRTAAGRPYLSTQMQNDIQQQVALLRFAAPNLKEIAASGKDQALITYVMPAITNRWTLPTTFPVPAPVSRKLSVVACPGQYEAATFAVYAFNDLPNMSLDISELKGPSGTLPAAVVDPYVVKCWFQGAGGIGHSARRVLKPELLLKDDGLIRVDMEKRRNFMRQTDAAGKVSYVDISRDLNEGATAADLKDLVPRDAAVLQPVTIPAGTVKQFWLTVHVPEDAKAGGYQGTIQLRSAAAPPVTLSLSLRVLPFRLAQSPITYSIYYRGILSADGKPTITSEGKSAEQMLAELRDMKAHGVDYPTCYQGFSKDLLTRTLQLRAEAGLPKGPFFSLGLSTGNSSTPQDLAAKQAEVKKWRDFLRPYGYDVVYAYGADEATGERLTSQKAAWKAVQEAGGKTFVAGYKGTFEAMGSLLNLLVYAGYPDPDEAKKAHAAGSLIFNYADPQVGVEEPETYRRNFGLLLAKNGFDGAMDYAYQHSFGHIWNDFDNASYRDHVFAYPTVNGVVDTTEWEGFREGVNDVRYLATLKAAVGNSKSAAAAARKWIAEFDPQRDPADLRAEMIDLILKLRR